MEFVRSIKRTSIILLVTLALTMFGCNKGKDQAASGGDDEETREAKSALRISPTSTPDGKTGSSRGDFRMQPGRCTAKNLELVSIISFLYYRGSQHVYEEAPLPKGRFDMTIDLRGADDPKARAKEVLREYLESEYGLTIEYGEYARDVWIVGDAGGSPPGVERADEGNTVTLTKQGASRKTLLQLQDLKSIKLLVYIALGVDHTKHYGELIVENKTGFEFCYLTGLKFEPIERDIAVGETVTLKPTPFTLTRKEQVKEGWIVREYKGE